MTDCAWRPKRRDSGWHPAPLFTHITYAQPRLPFVRSHQGRLVHRIRFWTLVWERVDGVVRFRSAHTTAWCGAAAGTRGQTIGSDVRLMADDSDSLCRRCFACEIVDRVVETGGLVSEASVEP